MIKFTKPRQFLGRNGTFIASGVDIFSNFPGDAITIQPLTSRGIPGRSWVEIPTDSLRAVIARLQEHLDYQENK